MTTLLLTRGPDPLRFELRRCGRTTRLLARARTFSLDRALAAGTTPDSSPLLSLRAQKLISPRHRARLAAELRDISHCAGHRRHPYNAALPIPRHVQLAHDLIDEVAELLAAPEAVQARGVALLELLLRDGGGPLYGAGAAEHLRRSLTEIVETLEFPPPIHTTD